MYLTPTLVSMRRWTRCGGGGKYLPPEGQAKNTEVLSAGLESLRVASEAGVTICYGSDLLGPLDLAQTGEFSLRARVLSAGEMLKSATVNPARMVGRGDEIGQIKEGFWADLLFLEENPLNDVTVFDRPEACVLGVMKEGRVYKSRWEGLSEDADIPVRVTHDQV